MPRILVPVDGSESSLHAVDHLIKRATWFKDPFEIHLLNVQPPLPGDVGRFLDAGQIRDFHRDEGFKDLEEARRRLDGAGIRYLFHIGIGEPAEIIAEYAREQGCDEIILGTHGRSSIASLLMGSVATKLVHLTEVPVLLVK
jgi:nucleotide-binding universal stress UspA family protein